MSEIPRASVARIIKNTGAARISGDSIDIFAEALEDYGTEIASKAISLARHAGRKTVKAEDMKLALKE